MALGDLESPFSYFKTFEIKYAGNIAHANDTVVIAVKDCSSRMTKQVFFCCAK